ncbi:hypothetical protein [Tessaracoccus sp. Y1736]
MVFKKKLSTPSSNTLRSSQQLAKELGATTPAILEALQEIGEYVDSPAMKSIVEPVAKRVAEHLGLQLPADPPHPKGKWEILDTQPSDTLRRQPRLDRRGSTPTSGQFGPPDRSLGLDNPRLDAKAPWDEQEWKLYGFSDIERDVWIDHGLRKGQAKRAAALRNAGLTPPDLGTSLYGWTVAKRLREGETPTSVKRLLDTQHKEATAG